MRTSRFLTSLFATVTALVLAIGLASALSSPASAAKPAHEFRGVKAQEIRDSGRFVVKGFVDTYKNKRVFLEKKPCKARRCDFKRFKSDVTSGKGYFTIRFDGPVGSCYRLVVPATSKNRRSTKFVGCIIRGARAAA